MKKLLIVLVALGLLLAVVTIAQAQEDPTYVYLGWPDLDGRTFTVASGESAITYLGWYACNRGLVNTWVNALNIEFTFEDGTTLYRLSDKHDPYWWDIYVAEPDESCIPESTAYARYWVYPISLDPGEYEISFHIWNDHQLTDAYDDDHDGIPDFYHSDRVGTFTLIFQ